MAKKTKPEVKRFVLDTNILLSFPHSMVEDFDEHIRYICGTVIQELNGKKKADGETGYNAREAGRVLDQYRQKGNLLKGVETESGGLLIFEPDGVKKEYLPDGFDINIADNRILSTCIHLNKQQPDNPVILVTSDVLMRIAATACGIACQEFRKVQIEEGTYTGHEEIETDWEIIEKAYKEKEIEFPQRTDFLENEFVTLTAGKNKVLTVYKNGFLHVIPDQQSFGNTRPKNMMQNYVMWALQEPADTLPLVILEGPAGAAKTYLSLAAGLEKTYTTQKRKCSQYHKMLITRPIANAFDGGQGSGYLPGTLEEKLQHLYQSYYDNLEILLRGGSEEPEDVIKMQMEDLFDDGVIEVGGLNFIRGRSLIKTYLMCDEAQNASKTLIRDVITRAGEGTKIVICGDPTQIDVSTLSKRNNGLVAAAESMKGSPLCAYLKLDATSSVRSALAKDAIKRMDW